VPHVRRAGQEVEAHRAPELQGELLAPQGDLLALLAAARQQTNGLGRRAARVTARLGLSRQRQEVAACRAAAHAQAHAAPSQAVGHGAQGHRQVRLVVRERTHGRPAQRLERVGHALTQQIAAEHAAVEEHRVGQRHALAHGLLRQLLVARQERGQVARHGGVGGIGQAQLHQAPGAPQRARVARDLGEEAIEHAGPNLVAHQARAQRGPDQLAAGAQHRDRQRLGGVGRQQPLLRATALVHQLGEAQRAQRALGAQLGLTALGQQEVHVVAAQHEVVAHGDARHARAALAPLHANEGEVRGAPAAVHHHHQLHLAECRVERAAVLAQEAVERGQRLLHQAHLRQSGQLRGGERERARGLVERRGHRQHHLLVGQRVAWVLGVPGPAHVGQVAGRGLHRRDLGHLGRRAPGQDRRAAVHGAVAQPALGAGHQPRGHARAQLEGQRAEHTWRAVRVQRARFGQLFLGGLVARRRQARTGGHLPGGHPLRQREHLRARQHALARRERVGEGHHRVGGAEVDAHYESRCHRARSVATRPARDKPLIQCGEKEHATP
jgi:hypothetical protein